MTTDPVLLTRALGKRIGARAILQDVTVRIGTGEVVGLLGKNGAGKSTLLDLLLGFALPTSGTAQVFGQDSARLTAAAKARIGFVPQSDELIGLMTGSQHLALVASFHEHWDAELVATLARDWEVPLDRRVGVLSGGERQKLATLMALGHRPTLLVLDEPASGLDPLARRRFMQTVLDIAADPARTILYSSHIVGDIERVCSHLWVLREGRVAWQGELDVLKESIVRLHVHARVDASPALQLPGRLEGSATGLRATVTLRDWRPDRLPALRRELDADIDVEPLALEDIFLALHA